MKFLSLSTLLHIMSADRHLRFLHVSEIRCLSESDEGLTCLVVGMLRNYDPVTASAKLFSCETRETKESFVKIDLSCVEPGSVHFENQIYRIMGTCVWEKNQITLQAFSARLATGWQYWKLEKLLELHHDFNKT